MLASKYFSKEAVESLRGEIESSDGNEVFALGYLDDKKVINKIRVIARGNDESVLAMHEYYDDAPDVLIHNHPSGFLIPSDNDMMISSRAAESGIGSYIVDNSVENVYIVAEAVKKRKTRSLNSQKICAALEPGGAISKRLPSYEIRESQMELMQLIIRGFNEDALVAAEAGTGVGKSFAYLIPALTYASSNDERIIISTATITLQEQLFNKDIPLVNEGLGKKVKTLLMKGRGNYLCQRRLEDALREPGLDNEERTHIEDIARWSDTTATGSRSELSFLPAENVWSRVCSEADTCMNMRCPSRERCFVMMLRREALDSKIIVVNHHLLFADLSARLEGAGYDTAVVLPPYNRIIIDEAHNAEDSATSFFSREFSRISINRQLGRLLRRRRSQKSGLLIRLASIIPGRVNDDMDSAVSERFENIRETADNLDKAALELCGTEGVSRLTPKNDRALQDGLFPNMLVMRKHLSSLCGFIREQLDKVIDGYQEDPVMWEIRSVLRRLDAIATVCLDFLEYKENFNDVMWIEKRQGSSGPFENPWAVFNVTPIDIAPSLKEALFEPAKTIICVSATLTTGSFMRNREDDSDYSDDLDNSDDLDKNDGGFDYWKKRSGLALVKDRKILNGVFPSPFPYQSKVLLASPSNSPLPTEPEYNDFVDYAASALTQVSGGSALVLFTSFKALNSAYEAAHLALENQGIRVLKQGDDERHRLLANFLNDESSVLFATDSFWEGVDAPGNTLRLVILCRLPFRSPNDPVFEARSEAITARGGSPFMELSLPEAVMRFKQGFGRLMRRSSDHGAVVVLDGRLLRKNYGEIFLRALPETKTCFKEMNSILRSLEEFIF